MKQLKMGLVIFLIFFFLTGCSTSTAPADDLEIAEEAATAVTQMAATDSPNAPPPTVTTAPTATTKPTDTPEPTEEPIEVQTNCVFCHSDKELLIETANSEEEKEPGESSGVG